MAYKSGKGHSPAGAKGSKAGQGKGGSKKAKYAGGSSQVKNPMHKKAQTTTVGNPGGKGFAPKDAFKDAGSTRTSYDGQTPGAK